VEKEEELESTVQEVIAAKEEKVERASLGLKISQ
jgi:hypothetical protein